MGYTNYYYVKKDVKVLPDEFLSDCRKVVDKWNETHEPTKLDLTANSKLLMLNGEAATCEWFVINLNPDKRFIQRDDDGDLFNFTKTRADAYDSAVKALCMIGLAYGIVSKWSFDGDNTDKEYSDAVDLLHAAGFFPSGTDI